jgi:hypothetical protein
MTTRAITIRLRGIALLLALACPALPGPAHAWDPSTTHQGVLEAAATRSAMHLRWMDASELERGLFSELRLDPDRLPADRRRELELAMLEAHADVGARPLGGPGACPPADAPPSTQLFCIDAALWEQTALAWLRLGMVAEVTPAARITHHFLDRDQPDAARWADPELSAGTLRRRQARSNGEPLAGVLTGTNFDGHSPSAIAWLSDTGDPLAPPQTFEHLELASTAATRAERNHHLALALIGVGALLHVMQDLGVPAHARGDATAFFAPLSSAPGDRGLPLQEFARLEYGRRDLPGVAKGIPSTPPSGVPLATTLLGHVLGDDASGYVGLATLAARRFFSESSLPSARHLDPTLDATSAAATLLANEPTLDPAELEGATLSPWPAERGYLLSPSGRALAAFDSDLDGRIRLFLDDTVYREQSSSLIPAGVEATRSLLDLLWPQWPSTSASATQVRLEIPSEWQGELLVFVETEQGERSERARVALAPELALALPSVGVGERVVLVVLATREPGPPIVLEKLLGSSVPTIESRDPAPIEPMPL